MFRFTIRDVLWLTALVAMGVGWRVERGNNVTLRDLHQAAKRLNDDYATALKRDGCMLARDKSGLFLATPVETATSPP